MHAPKNIDYALRAARPRAADRPAARRAYRLEKKEEKKSIGEEAVLGRDVNLFGRRGWYGHMEEDIVLGREGGMGGEKYGGMGGETYEGRG